MISSHPEGDKDFGNPVASRANPCVNRGAVVQRMLEINCDLKGSVARLLTEGF